MAWHSVDYTRRIRLFLALYARHARQRARTLLSVLGVALGVALGYGVHLVNRAAVEDLAAGVRAIAGDADLEVRGGRGGFAESVYVALARLPGVALSSPVLELEAGLAANEDGSAGTLRIIGLDPLRASLLQPQLFAGQAQLMAELLRPDTVLLSSDAARSLRLGKGGKLQIVVGLAPVELEVAGTLSPSKSAILRSSSSRCASVRGTASGSRLSQISSRRARRSSALSFAMSMS